MESEIMGYIRKTIEGLKEFYFRPGPNMALRIVLWAYYLIASVLFLVLTGRGLYYSIIDRDGLHFFYIIWILIFFWLWGGSLRLYPGIWDDDEYTSGRKFILTILILLAHWVGILVYFLSKRFCYDLPEDFSFSDILTSLNNPILLVVLGIIFILLIKLKQNLPAVFIWCFVCLYHLFKLLPEQTGESILDMKMLLGMMASTDLILFIGGVLATVVVAFFIYFRGD